ncbi:MAG: phosphoribosylformylglycinamidine synthase subunit PurS, partial [Pseudomonadota bacterium]
MMKARIAITLKNGVLDPQGTAISTALGHMGFDGINSVKQGKIIDIDLATENADEAEKTLKDMCEKLLANTV